jgi:hypothetical protein
VPIPIIPKKILCSNAINRYVEKIMTTNRGWKKKTNNIRATQRVKFLRICTYKRYQYVFHIVLAKDLIDYINSAENEMMCK